VEVSGYNVFVGAVRPSLDHDKEHDGNDAYFIFGYRGSLWGNGKRCGPGYTEGVTGPLVRAAELIDIGTKVTVLPGATAPEGAGGADEPWDEPEPESESESEPVADY
jgi:hypothetical protein